jgi:hypothetical protein
MQLKGSMRSTQSRFSSEEQSLHKLQLIYAELYQVCLAKKELMPAVSSEKDPGRPTMATSSLISHSRMLAY